MANLRYVPVSVVEKQIKCDTPKVPEKFRTWKHRQALLEGELLGADCDVVCVQEASERQAHWSKLLDLDGRFVRTIAARQFRDPRRLTASDGRVFVVDKYYEYYDEVDEEYDRGRVSKHARRKAEGGGVRRSGEAKAASKRAANPFQAAARRKAKS